MKIFTKLVSVFLLVAIGSLFFFSCAEKEKCTPMVSFLETALQQGRREPCGTGKGLISL